MWHLSSATLRRDQNSCDAGLRRSASLSMCRGAFSHEHTRKGLPSNVIATRREHRTR